MGSLLVGHNMTETVMCFNEYGTQGESKILFWVVAGEVLRPPIIADHRRSELRRKTMALSVFLSNGREIEQKMLLHLSLASREQGYWRTLIIYCIQFTRRKYNRLQYKSIKCKLYSAVPQPVFQSSPFCHLKRLKTI